MKLGVIADDFTGATDIASMLVRHGMQTLLCIGVPAAGSVMAAEAVVIALKSRTAPAAVAVAQAREALQALQHAGVQHVVFKICSTFDSTPAGNIGPVADALVDALGPGIALVCPALPENGRTVYRGHLFVGDRLLHESGMQHHPLTPMTDANLVRVLQAQTPHPVALLAHPVVAQGYEAVMASLEAFRAAGVRYVIADAIDDADLRVLARVAPRACLVVSGSGLAQGLPAVLGGTAPGEAVSVSLSPPPDTLTAILAGSCSVATQAQVAQWCAAGRPAWRLDPMALAASDAHLAEVLAWAVQQTQPFLVYATDTQAAVLAVQQQLGAGAAGAVVEAALAAIAQGVRQHGVQRFVVAGGETAGAVVHALGVRALRVGAVIEPGVPWTQALGQPAAPSLWLALKSGNFGSANFFAQAVAAQGDVA